MRQMPLGVRLADRAVFETFLPGPNAEAAQFLQQFARAGEAGAVFLWGAEGTGKSHLLQALCAAVPGSAYLPLHDLRALGPAALEGTEMLPAACIDDLDAVAGDAAWERALFRVYCDVQAAGGRLVFAARQPPAALPVQLRDLASRLAGSQVFALRPLDDRQQREALQLRARVRGLELPEDAAVYLQEHYPRDMRTLHELLDTLDSAALAAQRRLTPRFIRETLGA